MNVKPIEEFTLEECWSYLEQNSEGEMAAAVRQRVEQLRDIERKAAEKERKRQERDRERQETKRAECLENFLKEFDRFFVTQRYPEAFQRALVAFMELGPHAKIREKADLAQQKLSKRVPLFPKSMQREYYEFLIDALGKHYRKMRINEKDQLCVNFWIKIEHGYTSDFEELQLKQRGGALTLSILPFGCPPLYGSPIAIFAVVKTIVSRKNIRNILAEALIEEAIRIYKDKK